MLIEHMVSRMKKFYPLKDLITVSIADRYIKFEAIQNINDRLLKLELDLTRYIIEAAAEMNFSKILLNFVRWGRLTSLYLRRGIPTQRRYRF